MKVTSENKSVIDKESYNTDNELIVDIVSSLNIGDEFFWTPDRLVPFEHWVGHIPFIFWLVKVAKPERFVELGTHRGNSYCAMCQAVAALQIAATGTAVDTWQGDVHMAREEGLFEEIQAYHNPRYSSFSTLLRATFDEARPYFADHSIDLLHIDGTHTYDAVRHDFQHWKSAMSDRGLVLFHDIEVRRSDFGVWRLWEELSAEFPSIAFRHSHGLGVIAVGAKQPAEVEALFKFAKQPEAEARIRSLFSSRGSALVNRLLLSQTREGFAQHVHAAEQQAQLLQTQVDEARTRIVQLTEELEQAKLLQAQVDEAQSQLAQLTDEMERAHNKLADAQAKNEQLDVELNLLASELQQARNDVTMQRRRTQSFQQQLNDEVLARKNVEHSYNTIVSSTSWRLTSPLRAILSRMPRASRFGRRGLKAIWWTVSGQLPARIRARGAAQKAALSQGELKRSTNILSIPLQFIERAGGMRSASRIAYGVLQREGIRGLLVRIRRYKDRAVRHQSQASSSSRLNIVPYYLDPNPHQKAPVVDKDMQLAVHVHLHYIDMLETILERLKNIPVPFDLYISINTFKDHKEIHSDCVSYLGNLRNIYIERVPNRGRDIAPMIVQFGERLSQYDVIGHFHTKKSPHNVSLSSWSDELFNILLGKKDDDTYTVGQILNLLKQRAKIVFPQESTRIVKTPNGWGDNFDIARDLVEKYAKFSFDENLQIAFPEGFMFWARGSALREFLNLPLSFDDFPVEPIPSDGTIAHALERLILPFAEQSDGEFIRLYQTDSIKDYRYFENQKDYAAELENSDVKVLSYYLPQFHPTPENDEWHGTGFTELTKVRATNPLFEGHYQQHIPHRDSGYYMLDNPDILRKQAEQMRKSGVYGQVFYHYWFGGRMILEEPARMLLENKDIPMRFCFCWANENWTRRWDGNESEILLGQSYSPQDAKAFIDYLIPFFKDERYIKSNGRPLLFVYRPSHIETAQDYVAIWREACKAAGLKEPYVVAVLTRGATDPREFGMDAGVERVLHDWTNGCVPDIKDRLKQYLPMKGSVLSYPEVAEFYSAQKDPKDYTYFRSIVPMWDNTPRYGVEGIMLHGGTPAVFQRWLENLIDYSRKHLSTDERFVLVNAWNEWAEGAHLEPDTRHGYAYLNSVGRALTGTPYSSLFNEEAALGPDVKVLLSIPEIVIDKLDADPVLFEKFVGCLNKSTLFEKAAVSTTAPGLSKLVGKCVPLEGKPDYTIEFRAPCLFAITTLEKMLRTAVKSNSAVIPNTYGMDGPFAEVTENGSTNWDNLYLSPMIAIPSSVLNDGFSNIRMRTDARCFVTWPSSTKVNKRPRVNTIIRIHNSADFNELRNALYCLLAMVGCNVSPLIATQDLTADRRAELNDLLSEFCWGSYSQPTVMEFTSPDGISDLRSKMLNEALKSLKTGYAAFLDYDDLIFPSAYKWLIDRLRQTRKAVSFGRVYVTRYETKRQVFIDRAKVYEYGYSYDEFVRDNHAPIHSFIIDLDRVDVSNVTYFDDHKYMEDYYLMLQLLTRENADWQSLKVNKYIGDYIHATDRAHTLALMCDTERNSRLKDEDYRRCAERIEALRKDLLSRTA